MATAIFKLIAIWDVCKQLQSLSSNTGFRTLVSLTKSFDRGLHKIVETFDRKVFNEEIHIVHTSPSSKSNSSNGAPIVPLVSSKLENTFRCG